MAEQEFEPTNDENLARYGGIAEVRRVVTQIAEVRSQPEQYGYDFSRIKVGDQFYANGQHRFKFALNRRGDGFLQIFSSDGFLLAIVAVHGRRIAQDCIFSYFSDENEHRICSRRQMVKGKLQGLMFNFDQDDGNRLLSMCIFDRKGFSLVPWVSFDPDGTMQQLQVSCNYDQEYKYQLKPDYAKRIIELNPDNAVLQDYLQEKVEELGGSKQDYLTADNKLKPEFHADFYDLITQSINHYSREVHPELEAQFLEFCAGEKERRAQGIATTFDMVLDAIPQLKNLNS